MDASSFADAWLEDVDDGAPAADDDGDESDPLASDGERETAREEAEELFGASFDTLMAEGKRGGGKKRRRAYGATGSKRRVCELPPSLNARMGAATMAYMTHDFDRAEELLLNIIQEAPKSVAPYRTLALVCEERGDMAKSLSYLLFAAHLDRQDRDLWKRCASLSYDAGDADQAIYCLTQALKGIRGQDAEALQARATIFRATKQWRRAAENFIKITKVTPTDLSVYVDIAEMSALDGNLSKAEPYLEKAVQHFGSSPAPASSFSASAVGLNVHNPDPATPATKHESNVRTIVQKLIEIYFSQERFDDAHDLLMKMQDRRALGDIQTPFMQRVMMAVCQYRRGSRALASVAFNEFFALSSAVAENPSIMWCVAEACFAGKDHVKTVKAYSALATHPRFSKEPRLFLRRAEARMQLKDSDAAEKDARHAVALVPKNVEAMALLQRIIAAKNGTMEWNGSKAPRHVSRPAPDACNGASRPTFIKRPNTRALLRPTVAALVDTANSALISHGPDGYLHVLAPVLEAALGLPYCSLRSLSLVGMECLVAGGDCSELALTTTVQKYGEDLRALGQMLMKSFSDGDYVSFVERVMDALFFRGHDQSAGSAVEMLIATRGSVSQGPNEDLRIRTRALVVASLVDQGDLTGVYEELRTIGRERPSDSRVWWFHACLGHYLDEPAGATLRRRMNSSLSREVKIAVAEKDSIFAIGRIMASAVYCGRGRGAITTPRPAIRCFSYVCRHVQNVPSVALSTATYLLQMARNRKARNRGQLVLKAFSYVDEYRRLRRAQVDECPSVVKDFAEIEMNYNLARAMHDLGLAHMAAGIYMQLLDTPSEFSIPAWLQLKREIAFNLVNIFQINGQIGLARALVQRHLVF